MADTSNNHSETHVPSSPAGSAPGFLNPDLTLLIYTWFIFFLLLAILYKVAWKPLLAALDSREEKLRRSLGQAEEIQKEMAAIHEARDQILSEAEQKAKAIMEESRHAASEGAKAIHERAKAESQIILENARREIREETDQAQAQLRATSAELAISLSEKLLRHHLDREQSRQLINNLMEDI